MIDASWGTLRSGLLEDLGLSSAAELAEDIGYLDVDAVQNALDGEPPDDAFMSALLRYYLNTPPMYFVTPPAELWGGPEGTEVPHRDGCRCSDTTKPAIMMDERDHAPSFVTADRSIFGGERVMRFRRECYDSEGRHLGPELTIRSCEVLMLRAYERRCRAVADRVARPHRREMA